MKKVDKVIIGARKMLIEYLHQQCIDRGISTEQLAEMTGMYQSNISRIFSAKYSPTLDTILVLCKALNCYVFIIDKDADDDTVKLMRERWRRPADEQ